MSTLPLPIDTCPTLDTPIPDLLRKHPQARAVLDAYGLRGCGGAPGPAESLGFFARAHGVEPRRLLREVGSAVAAPPLAKYDPEPPTVADTIYRRYFLGGIVLILTAGASWGASLLWQIGFSGKFTGVSIHQVNAHGHAQIYGWVGLFIMGFAYQAFPRMWHTTLAAPRLATAAFGLMVAGLVVRTVGMTAAGGLGGHAAGVALAGGAAELLAILIFAGQLLVTFRRSPARVEPYVAFAFTAVLWFIAQAVLDLCHTWATMTAATTKDLLWHVATYQAPLRDLQVHGLALFMIFGVSLRMLPALFDLPPVPARRAGWALGVLTAAIVGEVILFVAYRWTSNHVLAALLLLPWLMLAAGAWLVAGPWRLWRPLRVDDRSGKFVRAAYAWLAVSLVMLLLLPVYQAVSRIPFSHAYYGAIRHAITVGFISLMIMGMAAKVVPTLNGVDPRRLSRLWGPFLLVNTGCLLRVSLQTLTDWHPAFFAAVGASGMLEVTGLAWWGAHVAGILLRGRRAQFDSTSHTTTVATARPHYVAGSMYVADVLDWFPATAAVFDRHGFALLRNPVTRRTMAQRVTVEAASRFRGVELGQLVEELAIAAGIHAEHGCEHETCVDACRP
jgi:hypothetical protein